jgi:tetratricopeptide (TPR) repeat protein
MSVAPAPSPGRGAAWAALVCSVLALATMPTAIAASATPDPTVLSQADALLSAGKAPEALALLASHELEWSGAASYDYRLGVAALDAGHPAEALFALERVLAVQPDFDGARMELGRALFETGDLEGARAQFSYLAGRQPPDAARAAIDRYLAAIDARAGGREQRWSGYAELGGGYDSNANASTSDRQFGVFTLDSRNVSQASSYVSAAAGLGHTSGFGNGLAESSSLRLDYRLNPDARFVDQAVASLNTALYWNPGAWRSSAGVGGYYGFLAGSPHEYYIGGNASVGRLIAGRWELGVQLSGGPLRYEDVTLRVLDVDRVLGALTLTRYDLVPGGGRLAVSVIGGADVAQGSESPYGNHKLGGRVTLDLPVARSVGLYAEAGVLRSDYENEPTFLLWQDRCDTQYGAWVGLQFDNWPAAGWTVAPHVRYVRNVSNVSLYDYDRWEAGATLRWSFR